MSTSRREIGSLLLIVSDFHHRIKEHHYGIDEFDFKIGKIQVIKGFYLCEDENNVVIETNRGDLEYDNIFSITEELMEYFSTKDLKNELSNMENYRPYMIICCGMICFLFKHLKTSHAKISRQLFESVLNKFLEFFFEIGVFNAELKKDEDILTLNCCVNTLKKLLKDLEFTSFKKRAVHLTAILQSGVTLRNEENSEEILQIVLECLNEEAEASQLVLQTQTTNSACILALNSLATADPAWLLEKEGVAKNLLILLGTGKDAAKVVSVLRCVAKLAIEDKKNILLNEDIMSALTNLLRNLPTAQYNREVHLVVLISCCEIVAALEAHTPTSLVYVESGLLKELIAQAVTFVKEKNLVLGKINDFTLRQILRSKTSQGFLNTSVPSLSSSFSSSSSTSSFEYSSSSSSSFLAQSTFSIPPPPSLGLSPSSSLTTPSTTSSSTPANPSLSLSPSASTPSSSSTSLLTRDAVDWHILTTHMLALFAPLVTKALDSAWHTALAVSVSNTDTDSMFPSGDKAQAVYEDVLSTNVLSLLSAYQSCEDAVSVVHSTTEFLFAYLRYFQLLLFPACFFLVKDAHIKKPEDLNIIIGLKFIHSAIEKCPDSIPALCALLGTEQFSVKNLKDRNDLLLLITLISSKSDIGLLGDVYWQGVEAVFEGDEEDTNLQTDVIQAERMLFAFFFCCAFSKTNVNTLCGKKFFIPVLIKFFDKSYGSVWMMLTLFLNLLTYYEKGKVLKELDSYGTGHELISNLGNVLHCNNHLSLSCTFRGVGVLLMHRILLTSTIHILTSLLVSYDPVKLLHAPILADLSALYRPCVTAAAAKAFAAGLGGVGGGDSGSGGNGGDSDSNSSDGSSSDVLAVELHAYDDLQLQLFVVPFVDHIIKKSPTEVVLVLQHSIPQMLVGFFLRVPPEDVVPPGEYAKSRKRYAEALRLIYSTAVDLTLRKDSDGSNDWQSCAAHMHKHDHLRLLYLVLLYLHPQSSSLLALPTTDSSAESVSEATPTFALLVEALCYAHAILPAVHKDQFDKILDYVVDLLNNSIGGNFQRLEQGAEESLLRAVTHAVLGLSSKQAQGEVGSGGGEDDVRQGLLMKQAVEETVRDLALAWKGVDGSSNSTIRTGTETGTGNMAWAIGHTKFVQTLLNLVIKRQFEIIILPFLQKLVEGMSVEERNAHLPSFLTMLKSFLTFDEKENVFSNPLSIESYLMAMRMLWIFTRTSPALVRESELASSSDEYSQTFSAYLLHYLDMYIAYCASRKNPPETPCFMVLMRYAVDIVCRIAVDGYSASSTKEAATTSSSISSSPSSSSLASFSSASSTPSHTYTMLLALNLPDTFQAMFATGGIWFGYSELHEAAHVLKLISYSGTNEVDPRTKKKISSLSTLNPYFSKFKKGMDCLKQVAMAMSKARATEITGSNIIETREKFLLMPFETLLPYLKNPSTGTVEEDEEEEETFPLHFNSVEGNPPALIFTEIYEDLLIAYYCMTKGREKDDIANRLLTRANTVISPFKEHNVFFQRRMLSRWNA